MQLVSYGVMEDEPLYVPLHPYEEGWFQDNFLKRQIYAT